MAAWGRTELVSQFWRPIQHGSIQESSGFHGSRLKRFGWTNDVGTPELKHEGCEITQNAIGHSIDCPELTIRGCFKPFLGEVRNILVRQYQIAVEVGNGNMVPVREPKVSRL
jgi:hypothetical protein